MNTRLSRTWTALALVAALAIAGCGKKAEHAEATVPALRFAGVDLKYALDRLATEAGWVLCVDEISPKDQSPDLSLVRVDMDLPAGPLDTAMRVLRDKVGGFDYQLDNGVLYVRSRLLVTDTTAIDVPLIDADHLEQVDLGQVVKYIMARHPSSFITVSYVQGGFAGPPTNIDIPAKASVKDVLIMYARNAKAGWEMRRAGQMTRDSEGNVAVIGTAVTPRGPRKDTSRVPVMHNKLSGASGLADATIRLQTPILIYDRSVLQDVRGALNFALKIDPKLPMKETLDGLGQSGFGPQAWHYHWREDNGVPVVKTRQFLFFLRGRDLFAQQLLPGDFEGSLGELARWINTHQKSPNGEVLMGGEIAEGQKRGKIQIATGDTVNDALVKFAKASGVSLYVIVLDMQNPITGLMIQNPRAWRGAYLQDLSEWHTNPGDERATGALPDEK